MKANYDIFQTKSSNITENICKRLINRWRIKTKYIDCLYYEINR